MDGKGKGRVENITKGNRKANGKAKARGEGKGKGKGKGKGEIGFGQGEGGWGDRRENLRDHAGGKRAWRERELAGVEVEKGTGPGLFR